VSNVITTIEGAEEALKNKVAWNHVPTLTDGDDGDLRNILADNVVGVVWSANTLYNLGDLVLPTEESRTGLMFACTSPGRSGDDEPEWNTVSGDALGTGGQSRGALADGDAVWQVHGPETDLWDVDEAAGDAWRKKAGLASDLVSTSRAGNQYNWSDIYTRCMEQANSHGGKFIV
jgi:hypothetical protein